MDTIQSRRKLLWNNYYHYLKPLEDEGFLELPVVPSYATNNAHMFYFVCKNYEQRTLLIDFLKSRGIMATFHYLPLHCSSYYRDHHDGRHLPNAARFSDCLIRLPMYFELAQNDLEFVACQVIDFFKSNLRPKVRQYR